MENNVVLRFDNVTYGYDEKKPLLKEASFSVRNNSKITIIGQNGAGKSTIFKLITGELKPLSGSIHMQPGTTVGIGLQMVPKDKKDLSVEEFMKSFLQEIPFDIVKDIKEMMDVVNLSVPLDKKVDDLSGGQQARLLLATALLQNPDILLLDEPTNNLDKDGISHLTYFLMYYPKTVIVISHDADFLNEFTEGMLNLDVQTRRVEQFVGNYYDVLDKVSDEIEKQQLQNARLKKEIRQKNERVNKLGGKSVQLRKIANKMRAEVAEAKEQMVEVRRDDKSLRTFEIPAQHLTKAALTFSSVEFLRDGDEISLPVDIEIRKGDRMRISGPNGVGKSTFLTKIMNNQAKGVHINPDVTVGYYSQDFSELNYDQVAFDCLLDTLPESAKDKQLVYATASQFLLPGDVLQNPIRTLSEGQKGLLCYARFVLLQPGLLIMDEPTNHINFRHIPAITEALNQFKGAMVVISHYEPFVDEIEFDFELDFGMLGRK